MKFNESMFHRTFVPLILLLAAAGCSSKSTRRAVESAIPVSGGAELLAASRPGWIEAGEPSVRDETMYSIPELKEVRFDYARDIIGPDARPILVGNARWLARHREARVQVAGHCDQRGTVEYNMALGQRRAAAVRQYYIHLGIAADRIATISYGKERPLCRQDDEDCWYRNRRAETLRAISHAVADSVAP